MEEEIDLKSLVLVEDTHEIVTSSHNGATKNGNVIVVVLVEVGTGDLVARVNGTGTITSKVEVGIGIE